jgi:CubicO group peptidase (beta-lactamase class C family)
MKIRNIQIFLLGLVCLSSLSSCLKDDNQNLPFNSFQPVDIGDGTILSNPENENMNRSLLEDLYSDIYTNENLWSLRSLLIYRNGHLVSEAYLKDVNDISEKHLIWSCTKQVVGMLTGMAIEQGIIGDVSDPISIYLGNELTNHPDKKDITIEDLLLMQSGIDYNNGEETDEILRKIPENSIDFILSLPLKSEPQTDFFYNDGNPHLISGIIHRKTGMALDQWADENLFSKIEVTNYNWVRYIDGITLGGFGIETTPRELSKIAICVADKGRWKSKQIIASQWIEKMTSPIVQTQNPDFSFGYFWWVIEDRNISFMWGVGGQFAFIVPHKNLVVVMTSYPNTKGEYEIQADEALEIVDKVITIAN